MEAAMAERKNGRGRSTIDPNGQDAELRRMKKNGTVVDLTLAADFSTPDGHVFSADDCLAVEVVWVDRYSVKFKLKNTGREVWINKAFIAGVWLR